MNKNMSKLEQIDEYSDEMDVPLLLLGDREDRKNFEPAIIGIAHRFGMEPSVAYDYDMVIDIFAKDFTQDMIDNPESPFDEDDDAYTMAVEHFDYNVIGAWSGEHTPLFIKTLD